MNFAIGGETRVEGESILPHQTLPDYNSLILFATQEGVLAARSLASAYTTFDNTLHSVILLHCERNAAFA